MVKHQRTLHENPDKKPSQRKKKVIAPAPARPPPPQPAQHPALAAVPMPIHSRPADPLPYRWDEAERMGLQQDADITEVMRNLKNSVPFWEVTAEDIKAAQVIRARYPRVGHSPEEDVEDKFDEGVSKRFPAALEVTGSAPSPDEPGVDLRVLSRPQWQVKYIMAKAKLMLVEEENRMRKDMLRDIMEMERALRKRLAESHASST